MAPYLLPVVLAEFHVCNVHDLMQCLSLLPQPFVASLLITSLNALGNFKQKLEDAGEGLVMEEVDRRDLETHDFKQRCYKPFNVFDVETKGSIFGH